MRSRIMTFSVISVIIIASLAWGFSSGAPIGSISGACSPCHSGTLNPSGGSLAIGVPATYRAKDTITVTVTPPVNCTGFAVRAANSANTTVGTYIVGGGVQVVTSGPETMVTHATSVLQASWTFKWIAPSTAGTGTMTFSGAALTNFTGGRYSGSAAVTEVVTSCCTGNRGDVNSSGSINLADLSALASYLTGGGFVPSCTASADVNGSGSINLADLSALATYLTGGAFVLVSCP